MRRKIFVYYVILIVSGISIAGFFVSHLTHRLYENEVLERLKISASLIEYQLSDYKERGIPVNYDDIAAKYADILSLTANDSPYSSYRAARITIIDSSGNVMENPLPIMKAWKITQTAVKFNRL